MDEFDKIIIENWNIEIKNKQLSKEHQEQNDVLHKLQCLYNNLKQENEELKHDLHITRMTCDNEHENVLKLQEQNKVLEETNDRVCRMLDKVEQENKILETALNDMIAMHFDDNSQPISYGKNGETYCRYLKMDNLTCKKQSTISWSDCRQCYKNQLLLNAKYQTLLKGINNHESND